MPDNNCYSVRVLLIVIFCLTIVATSLDPVPSNYTYSQHPSNNVLQLSREKKAAIIFKVCRSDAFTGFQVLQLAGIGESAQVIQNIHPETPVYTPEIHGIKEIIYNVMWESINDYCKIATAKVEGATIQNGTVLKCGLFPNQTTTYHTIIGEVIIIAVEHQVVTIEPITTEPATTTAAIPNTTNKAKGVQSDSVRLVVIVLVGLLILLMVL